MEGMDLDPGQLHIGWWSKAQLEDCTSVPRNKREAKIFAIRDQLATVEEAPNETNSSSNSRELVLFAIRQHYANQLLANEKNQPELEWQQPQLPATLRYWPTGFSGIPELFRSFAEHIVDSLQADSCEQHFQAVVALAVAAKHTSKGALDKIYELATPDNQVALTALHVLTTQIRSQEALKEIQQAYATVTYEPRYRIRADGFWRNQTRDAISLQNGILRSVTKTLKNEIASQRIAMQSPQGKLEIISGDLKAQPQPNQKIPLLVQQLAVVTMAEAGIIKRSNHTNRQRWFEISRDLQDPEIATGCEDLVRRISQNL